MFRKKYQVIGMGGTFDHFHAGHAHFIDFAATLAEKLVIGVTTEKLTRTKSFANTIEPYATRFHAIKAYCRKHGIRCEVTELNDIYGPTLEGNEVHALCVTDETVSGASKINIMRDKLGLYQLPVHICDFVLRDDGQPLHAEAIRAGRVNRTGQTYASVLSQDLELSEAQRRHFSQPQGEILDLKQFKGPKDQPPFVAVVGDTSLETFITHKWKYNLGVFDHLRQRQPFESKIISTLKSDFKVNNPSGVISTDLINVLNQAISRSRTYLQIEGEEDLAAVALILLAPLYSHIYYGQPDKGIICMELTEELKDEAYHILKES